MNAPCSIIDRQMTRAVYDARRRAAFLATRSVEREMRAAEYADSPGWAQAQIQQRCQSIVDAVPSPHCWVEYFFLQQMAMRRNRVLSILRERTSLANKPREVEWCRRLTVDLRDCLDCWKKRPIHMVPVPLPRDRKPTQFQFLRAA